MIPYDINNPVYGISCCHFKACEQAPHLMCGVTIYVVLRRTERVMLNGKIRHKKVFPENMSPLVKGSLEEGVFCL